MNETEISKLWKWKCYGKDDIDRGIILNHGENSFVDLKCLETGNVGEFLTLIVSHEFKRSKKFCIFPTRSWFAF